MGQPITVAYSLSFMKNIFRLFRCFLISQTTFNNMRRAYYYFHTKSTVKYVIFGSDYINRRLICHLEKLKAMKLDLEMGLQSVQPAKTTGVSTTYFTVLKEAHLHTIFTPKMSNASRQRVCSSKLN